MLKRKNKLSRRQFDELFKEKKVAHSSHFSFRFITIDSEMDSDFEYGCAVVISKKVERFAIKRNKAKRRVYHILRSLDGMYTKTFNGVFTVKKQILIISASDLRTEIEGHLKQAQLI